MSELVDTEVLENPSSPQPKVDLFDTYLTTSSKLRKKMIDIYDERLDHQRKILKKKMNLDQDITQKNLYNDYLDKIYTIEKEAVDQLNKISLDRERELAIDKEDLYNYFDQARKDIEKWKESNPQRYQSEMEFLNQKERIKIQTIEKNAMRLFNQSQAMFDKIIKIFHDHDEEMEKQLG